MQTKMNNMEHMIESYKSMQAYMEAANMLNDNNKDGYVDLCTELERQNKYMKDKLLFTIDNVYKNWQYSDDKLNAIYSL